MVQRAVAGAEAEHARRFFLDADVHVRQRLIRPLLALEIDLLEIAQLVQGHVTVLELGPAVEIALHHGELTADHLVPRLVVAGDVDPVEIDQLRLLDFVGHIDGQGFLPRFGAGNDVGVGIAFIVARLCQEIQVLHDRFTVVEVLLPDLKPCQEIGPGGRDLVSGDFDLADAELLPLRDRNLDADPVAVVCDDRLADLGVDEAAVQVEGVQLAHVLFELVLFEEAGVGEKVEDAPFVGGHHVLQLLRGEGPVALEADAADEELLVFDDRDDDVDVPFARLFDCVTDLGVVEPFAVIEGLDLLHVALEFFGVDGLPVADAHRPFDVVPFHRLVALDPDLGDQRFFFDEESDRLSLGNIGHFRGDVIEIAHLVDGLDVGGKVLIGEDAAGCALEDLLDGAGFDLAVALERDADDLLIGGDSEEDVHPEPGQNGPQVLPAAALNEHPRQDLSLAKIDQSGIDADPVSEFGNASRDGIAGAGLFPHLDDQGVVDPFPCRAGVDLFPLDQADVFRFLQFRCDSPIEELLEFGGPLKGGAVGLKREESDLLDVFCCCSRNGSEKNHDQKRCDACKRRLFIHGYTILPSRRPM